MKLLQYYTLRESCPYSEIFWSVFSHIRTEYRPVSPYSVRMQENTDQKNSKYGHFSRSDTEWLLLGSYQLTEVQNRIEDPRC